MRTIDPGASTTPAAIVQPGGTCGSLQKYSQRASRGARLTQPWLRLIPNWSCQYAVCSARPFSGEKNCVHGTVATEYGSSPLRPFMSASDSFIHIRYTPVSVGVSLPPELTIVAYTASPPSKATRICASRSTSIQRSFLPSDGGGGVG